MAGARKPLKRVGPNRYMYGGRFVTKGRYDTIRKARARAAAARRGRNVSVRAASTRSARNPRRRRNQFPSDFAAPTKPRKKRKGGKTPPRGAGGRFKKKTTKKKKPKYTSPKGYARLYQRKKKPRKAAWKRRESALKAAKTRAKRKKAGVYGRKKKTTTKRKRKTTRRKPVAKKRSTASRRAAALKGIRRQKAKKAARSRAGRKATKRRLRKSGFRIGKKRKGVKGAVMRTRSGRRKRTRLRRGKRGMYNVRRTRVAATSRRKAHWRGSLTKAQNPVKAVTQTLKKVLPIYGGVLAFRAINGLVGDQINKSTTLQKIPASVRPFVSPLVMLLGATWLLPKTKVLKGALLEGLQLGAAMGVFDAAVKQFVVPALAKSTNPTMLTLSKSLAGYDDMGMLGYGAYLPDPGGYSLPTSPSGPIGLGMGADVHEAMADYVQDVGMGAPVEEALTGGEEHYLQTGGAAGSLSGTLFRY